MGLSGKHHFNQCLVENFRLWKRFHPGHAAHASLERRHWMTLRDATPNHQNNVLEKMTIIANVGVPMLFVQMPLLLVTLPIVILIEGALCRRWFSLKWGRALKVTSIANLLSTLAGFPLLWIALVVLQMILGGGGFPRLEEPWFSIYTVTAQAAWLLPVEDELYWMIPTACLVLLVPAFFVTIFIERRVYRKHFANDEGPIDPISATWKMHFASYGFLALAGFALLGSSINQHNREGGGGQPATRSESK